MPEISVIMLVYNREKYVSRAIDSILNQTFNNYEFIIIDNGSIDSSGTICDRYSQQNEKIKVVHREKGNIGSGRNAGLDLAKGKYITFVDDDDVASPDMLEFLYKLITEHDADISLCGSYKEVNGKVIDNCVFEDLLVMDAAQSVVELLNRKKYNVAMPTKLLRRELFDKVRFLNEGKYDDITVGYKFFSIANKVVYLGKPKYTFLRHEKNNSNFTTNDLLLTPEQLDEYFEAFKERTEYVSEKLPQIAEFVEYTEWSYMISMCNKIVSNNLIKCSEQLEHVKKILIRNYEEFYNSEFLKDFEREWMDKYIKGDLEYGAYKF